MSPQAQVAQTDSERCPWKNENGDRCVFVKEHGAAWHLNASAPLGMRQWCWGVGEKEAMRKQK